ncbi:hypothetical protein PV04_08441 [Phialophora macrospora]|uniref:Uncharacterized protein n=1 Tax=Phialophora macrospora TaxID=1851006 RepID=A0A0D2CLW6_9EURO|nr:hypothetical protein PV04_08441 [Phialophora macrospora]
MLRLLNLASFRDLLILYAIFGLWFLAALSWIHDAAVLTLSTSQYLAWDVLDGTIWASKVTLAFFLLTTSFKIGLWICKDDNHNSCWATGFERLPKPVSVVPFGFLKQLEYCTLTAASVLGSLVETREMMHRLLAALRRAERLMENILLLFPIFNLVFRIETRVCKLNRLCAKSSSINAAIHEMPNPGEHDQPTHPPPGAYPTTDHGPHYEMEATIDALFLNHPLEREQDRDKVNAENNDMIEPDNGERGSGESEHDVLQTSEDYDADTEGNFDDLPLPKQAASDCDADSESSSVNGSGPRYTRKLRDARHKTKSVQQPRTRFQSYNGELTEARVDADEVADNHVHTTEGRVPVRVSPQNSVPTTPPTTSQSQGDKAADYPDVVRFRFRPADQQGRRNAYDWSNMPASTDAHPLPPPSTDLWASSSYPSSPRRLFLSPPGTHLSSLQSSPRPSHLRSAGYYPRRTDVLTPTCSLHPISRASNGPASLPQLFSSRAERRPTSPGDRMHIRRGTGGLSGRRRPPTINTDLPSPPSSNSHCLLSDNSSSAPPSRYSNSSTRTCYYMRPTIERLGVGSPLYILRLLRRPTSVLSSTSTSSSSTSSHFSRTSTRTYYRPRTRNPIPHHAPVSLTPMERFLRHDMPPFSAPEYSSGGHSRLPAEASTSRSTTGLRRGYPVDGRGDHARLERLPPGFQNLMSTL